MKNIGYITVLVFLIICGTPTNASVPSEESQVTLTLYLLDGRATGPILPDVSVTSYDAEGNDFTGITDSNGSVVITGMPGTWSFLLAKNRFETADLKYNVSKSHVAAAYLRRLDLSIHPDQVMEGRREPSNNQSQTINQMQEISQAQKFNQSREVSLAQETNEAREIPLIQEQVILMVNIHEGNMTN
jgi:hypothetical protein